VVNAWRAAVPVALSKNIGPDARLRSVMFGTDGEQQSVRRSNR
jgi:hypothetical protein